MPQRLSWYCRGAGSRNIIMWTQMWKNQNKQASLSTETTPTMEINCSAYMQSQAYHAEKQVAFPRRHSPPALMRQKPPGPFVWAYVVSARIWKWPPNTDCTALHLFCSPQHSYCILVLLQAVHFVWLSFNNVAKSQQNGGHGVQCRACPCCKMIESSATRAQSMRQCDYYSIEWKMY